MYLTLEIGHNKDDHAGLVDVLTRALEELKYNEDWDVRLYSNDGRSTGRMCRYENKEDHISFQSKIDEYDRVFESSLETATFSSQAEILSSIDRAHSLAMQVLKTKNKRHESLKEE